MSTLPKYKEGEILRWKAHKKHFIIITKVTKTTYHFSYLDDSEKGWAHISDFNRWFTDIESLGFNLEVIKSLYL